MRCTNAKRSDNEIISKVLHVKILSKLGKKRLSICVNVHAKISHFTVNVMKSII